MLKNRVYRACAATTQASQPSHQVKFLFARLQDLLPTNDDCYLSACNGSYCIIDRYRPAVAGSRVLIDIAGRREWATIRCNPEQIVTAAGTIIEGEQLQEVTILGVAIQEVLSIYQHRTAQNAPV